MSLISFRNLKAPLDSKFQMGGLIIAALLVLVIRLGASGSANAGSDGERVASTGADALGDDEALRRAQLRELLEDPAPAVRPRSAQGARPASDEVLGSLVDGRFDKEQREKRKHEETNGNSFEDIRRSLGID